MASMINECSFIKTIKSSTYKYIVTTIIIALFDKSDKLMSLSWIPASLCSRIDDLNLIARSFTHFIAGCGHTAFACTSRCAVFVTKRWCEAQPFLNSHSTHSDQSARSRHTHRRPLDAIQHGDAKYDWVRILQRWISSTRQLLPS